LGVELKDWGNCDLCEVGGNDTYLVLDGKKNKYVIVDRLKMKLRYYEMILGHK